MSADLTSNAGLLPLPAQQPQPGYDINGYPLPANAAATTTTSGGPAPTSAPLSPKEGSLAPAANTASATEGGTPAPAEHAASDGNPNNQQPPSAGGSDVETYQNLFITKLHRNIKDQDLLALFAPFGGKSATVMLDAKTGRSKGFGFVLFDTEAEGKRAHEAMHQKQISVAGCTAQLSIFPSKHDAKHAVDPSPSLYVRNVPISAPKEEVEAMLEQFGSVAFCAMREEPDGLPVWVILVEYDCQMCADNALSHLRHNTTMYPQGPLPVIAKYAKAMDRKRSLTSRKRQNASKNCPFRASRYAAGGVPAGPLSGGSSYGSSFNEGSSYGNSVGSDSMGSATWAAQMSASQPTHMHSGHAQPQAVPQYVTTTTNPNGSTTTTAYFAGGAPPPEGAMLMAHNPMMYPMNPMMGQAQAGGAAMMMPPNPMAMAMAGNPFIGAAMPGAVGAPNSTMFVFQPPAAGGAPAGQPPAFMQPTYAQLAQQHQHQHAMAMGQYFTGAPNSGAMMPPHGMMMAPNGNQFATYAPNPAGAPAGTNFYGAMPPAQQQYPRNQ